jgi:hypothetical protein
MPPQNAVDDCISAFGAMDEGDWRGWITLVYACKIGCGY